MPPASLVLILMHTVRGVRFETKGMQTERGDLESSVKEPNVLPSAVTVTSTEAFIKFTWKVIQTGRSLNFSTFVDTYYGLDI